MVILLLKFFYCYEGSFGFMILFLFQGSFASVVLQHALYIYLLHCLLLWFHYVLMQLLFGLHYVVVVNLSVFGLFV
jgi:hypothetical protein